MFVCLRGVLIISISLQNQRELPGEINKILHGYKCSENKIGYSSANVYKYTKGSESLYLKSDSIDGELVREYALLTWLQGKLPVPKIKFWQEVNGCCYLLMSEVGGFMACDDSEEHLREPQNQTIKLLADGLLMLQSVPIYDCPHNSRIDDKLAYAMSNIKKDLVDMDDFEDGNEFSSPIELYNCLVKNRPVEDLTFTHGDYCLPNVFIDGHKVTGFIDMGRAGIADKWSDIALCVRSLGYNIYRKGNTEKYVDLLFEYLNIEPDWEKINYYILMDELF